MKIATLSLLNKPVDSRASENHPAQGETLDRLGLKTGESRLARVLTASGSGDNRAGAGRLQLEMNGQMVPVRSDRSFHAETLVRVMRAGNELQLTEILNSPTRSTLAQALAQKIPSQHHLGEGLGQLLNHQPDNTVPEPARQALQRLIQMLPRFNAEGSARQTRAREGLAFQMTGSTSQQRLAPADNLLSLGGRQMSPLSANIRNEPFLNLSPAEPVTADRVRNLVENSGLLREARMITAPSGGTTNQSPVQANDLKAQLIQAVARLVGEPAAEGSTAAGAKQAGARAGSTDGQLTRLSQLKPATTPHLTGQDALRFPAPMTAPTSGTSAAGAQGGSESINAGETLRLLAGMINRITVNQLHSQAASTGGPEGQTANQTWILELPWISSTNEVKLLQGRIEQQDNNEQEDADREESQDGAQREWRLNLALDLEGTGPVYLDVSLRGRSLNTTIWAERSATVDLVQRTSSHLESALARLDLDVRAVQCFHGKPPAMVTRLSQQLVDEHA